RFSLNSYKNKKFELRALPQYLNEKQNLIINSFSLKDAKNIIYKNCVYDLLGVYYRKQVYTIRKLRIGLESTG
ncbi:MAG: hypothetical protein ACXVCA_12990, partial [Bdellovibrio sp.]